MKKNKMFVIFDRLEKFHLTKDVGELPLALKKSTSLDISFLSSLKKFNDEFTKEIPLLFFDFTTKKNLNKLFMYLYVLWHCRKLNYIMTFHIDIDKFILFYLCKIINPKLTTYIKLDMDEPTALSFYEKNDNYSWKRKIKYYLARSVDIFTIETKSVYKLIKQNEMLKNKLFYLPNGFRASRPYDFSVKKEKMVISVGRIGAPQKHNELLLDAIEQLENFNGYTFYFIGPIERNFQTKYNQLLGRRVDLKNKIILTGNIDNQNELFDYYRRAEFLCFSSLYEGFSLVLTEGLFFGCYILSTDLGASYDIIKEKNNRKIIEINNDFFRELQNNGIKDIVQYINKNYEKIINSEWHKKSVLKLSKVLQDVVNGNIDLTNSPKKCSNYIYQDLNWSIIADKLYVILNRRKND